MRNRATRSRTSFGSNNARWKFLCLTEERANELKRHLEKSIRVHLSKLRMMQTIK